MVSNQSTDEDLLVEIVNQDDSTTLPGKVVAPKSGIPLLELGPNLSATEVIRLTELLVEYVDANRVELDLQNAYAADDLGSIQQAGNRNQALYDESKIIAALGDFLAFSLCKGTIEFARLEKLEWKQLNKKLRECGVGSEVIRIVQPCKHANPSKRYVSLAQFGVVLKNFDPFEDTECNKNLILAVLMVVAAVLVLFSFYANRDEPKFDDVIPRQTVVAPPTVKTNEVTKPLWLRQTNPYNGRWKIPCEAESWSTFAPMIKKYKKMINVIRHAKSGKILYRSASPVTPSNLVANAIKEGTDISGANFELMNLSDVDFKGIDLSDARFSQCELGNMSKVTFRNCLLEKTACNKLHAAKFLNSTLRTCYFVHADLENSLFENTEISNCILPSANCTGTTLRQCDLRNLIATMAKFDHAMFEKTSFTDVNFEGAFFRQSTFARCVPSRCIFANARFHGLKSVSTIFDRSYFSYQIWDK